MSWVDAVKLQAILAEKIERHIRPYFVYLSNISTMTSRTKLKVFLVRIFYLLYVLDCLKFCQAQDTPLIHETVNIDSQPSFGTVHFARIDKTGKLPLLSFHFTSTKTIDNSFRASISVYMKITEIQKDYTKLLQTQGPACDLSLKSSTMKSFARFGNLTAECPKVIGEYYVTNHYFAPNDFPPIPGKKVKVTVKVFKPEAENDVLQFTYTGKVNQDPRKTILSVLNRGGQGGV